MLQYYKIYNLFYKHLIIIILFSFLYYYFAIKYGSEKDVKNFNKLENCFYYTTITHFTIGFGDITPESSILKRFTILQIFLAFYLMN